MTGCGVHCAEIVARAIGLLDDPRASEAELNAVSLHLATCSACHDSVDCYSRTGVLAMRVRGEQRGATLFERVEASCHSDRAPVTLVAWMHAKGFANRASMEKPARRTGTGAVSPFSEPPDLS